MALKWTVKKQIFYFTIVLLVFLLALFFVYLRITAPTCSDGRQNQGEVGIDCGGPCEKECLGEIKDLIVLWNKVFKIGKGSYDAVILVENPNPFLSLPSVKYQLKVYDNNNILITVRAGETFINPGETFPIFETNIDTGERLPAKIFIEFEKNLKWERLVKERPSFVISKKQFSNNIPFPKLTVRVENKTMLEIKNIYAAAVLYDKDKNAKAASVTKIDSIKKDSSKEVSFTWPNVFSEEPVLSEIFLRTDLNK